MDAASAPWLVVVNPAAGAGRGASRWPAVAAELERQGVSFEAAFTQKPGDAAALAERAAGEGCAAVVAAGGDGTINEVVNGLMAVRAGGSAVPALGVLPLGTAQDFARSARIPLGPRAAVAYLRRAQPVPVDIGRIRLASGAVRYFATYAGTGFDALVVARAKAWGRRWRGALPYVAAFFQVLRGYGKHDFAVRLDGQPLETRHPIHMIVVANGANYAGLLRMAPAADMHDGLLDVIVIGDVGRLEFLVSLPLAVLGRHLAHPKVTAARARAVVIESADPLPVQHDGEEVGTLPATFDVLPGALLLLSAT